ncbi:hypothetical protein EAF00_006684 [Botryotinia globosa]|nr:hypothetical protein EAF00_006684 [Botryotinia globosa]
MSPLWLNSLSNNSIPPQLDHNFSTPLLYRTPSSLTASHKRYSMLAMTITIIHFHMPVHYWKQGNCIPYTNNSGSRAIDPLIDLELADLNNIYSTNTANAPIYRVTALPTPPEPDLLSPSWQLDDIPAAQNGTILPPQLPRKNESQHSTCSLCGWQNIASLDKTHNSITTSNKHSGSELPFSSSPVHSHALPSTLASSSAAIDTFLTDGPPLYLAGYSLIVVKKPNITY